MPICEGFCDAFKTTAMHSSITTISCRRDSDEVINQLLLLPLFKSELTTLKCLQGNVALNSPPNTWRQTERKRITKPGTWAQRFPKCDKLRRGVQEGRCHTLQNRARGRGIAHRGRRVKRNGDGRGKVQTSASTTKAECPRRVGVSRPLVIVYTRWMKALSAGSLKAFSSVWWTAFRSRRSEVRVGGQEGQFNWEHWLVGILISFPHSHSWGRMKWMDEIMTQPHPPVTSLSYL